MQFDSAQLRRISPTFLVLAWVAACNTHDYAGDGVFVDNGALAANQRYVLSLGEVSGGEASFRVSGLPDEDFTFGLELTAPTSIQSLCDSRPIENIVEMELLSPANTVEFSAAKPLNEWVWSCRADSPNQSFVYLWSESARSTVRLQRSGVYLLNVRIERPMPESFVVNVIGRGGGWK